ncbi:hypothetical protein MRX58_13170 (plasmid) [Xylella fastidiosa subsp. pauca]|uniref:hypothetical protein n=1 Tax=Xylella fastidiosa TaxID=2371 RepID=UPI0024204054|nr:hypothetical protein [Xylella fastidiosa]MDG5824450.1 hypothetical protein [Xylella fastidiosa subsp. pauca]MDG5827021.1 hypothetical protein [Xylella fastidiosa subsp. pauca]
MSRGIKEYCAPWSANKASMPAPKASDAPANAFSLVAVAVVTGSGSLILVVSVSAILAFI